MAQTKEERGEAVERAWAKFFEGSILAQDVIPLKGAEREGHEGGCDLLLGSRWCANGGVRVLQVKSGLEYAIAFLHEGGLRGEVIPTVVGIPPVEGFQENVLSALREQYVWFPRSYWTRRRPELVAELDHTIHALRTCRVQVRHRAPRWLRVQ